MMIVGNCVMIYIDGVCLGNFGLGGWGVILWFGEYVKELSGGESEMINNWMELMVVIEVLNVLKWFCVVDFYIDSIYVCSGISEWMYGWKCKNWCIVVNKLVKNVDLW